MNLMLLEFKEPLYRNKIAYLDIVLAILIVVRHSVNYTIYDLDSGFLYYFELFISEMTDLIVPMFFVLSGFLFFQNLTWNKMKNKLVSRFKSLVIPYIAWGTISYLLYQGFSLLPIVSNNINRTIESFSLIGMVQSVLQGAYNGPLWFLQYLIGYMMLTPIIFFFLENPLSKKCTKVYGVCTLVVIFTASFFMSFRFTKYLIPFIFGAYAGRYLKCYVQQQYCPILRIVAGVVIVLTILLGLIVDFGSFYIAIRLCQAAMIWLFADYLAVEKEPKEWMRISFVVFCSHSLILEPLEKLFLIIIGKNILGAWLDFLFAPIIVLVIILVCSLVCKKIPCLWKLLSGWR